MRFALLAALGIGMMFAQTMKYPAAKKADVVDDYHGTRVADPFRWLEDADSPETAKWVEAQNAVTRDYLAKVPRRGSFKDRLLTLYNYERFNGVERVGPRYLITRNDGLQNQDVLYVADSLNGTERVLLDPNTLRADGTTALAGHHASKDGKLLAYGIAEAGSDWTTWRVRDIETGKDLPDVIRWSKFSTIEWTPDHRGFYYQRFAEPKPGQEMRAQNEYAKLYLHRLGEPQSADKLVYERPDQKQWMFYPEITEDGRFLLLTIQTTDFGRNLLFYQDLRRQPAQTVELIRELTAQFIPLGTRGSVVYFSTTDNAPRGRIVAIDLEKPDRASWREIVPQQKEPIDAARMVSRRLVLSYLKDAASAVRVFDLDGKLVKDVALPGVGQVSFLPSRPADPEMFFLYVSFTSPAVTYRLDPPTGAATVVRQSKVGFDPSRFEAERVFYTSKDGTRIPMALVHRKGIERNGQTPTILYGYGGFNSSVLPTFNPAVVAWMEMGGMFAVANIRGGAEYGDEWHEAGKREKKQNVFDDFIAAAEWLIAQKYTSTPKLAVYGGSNGGLLVGAVINQRPDLFGAAMPAVGVMDMLRFQKFTIGAAWVDEYGSSDDPAQFKTLRAYSPLHNIKAGANYPAVFITTSDHDDRVVPGHSFKYAATLQDAQQSAERPALIRIETRAGHGAGKPVTKIIEEWADRLAFLSKELGVQ
jgi:prolyl oligopeptidase